MILEMKMMMGGGGGDDDDYDEEARGDPVQYNRMQLQYR